MSTTELEEVFREKNIEFSTDKNNPYEIKIRCFSGLHEDKDPSLRYNIIKEVFNCFSCGFKGNKKDMYTALGISVPENLLTRQGFKIAVLQNKLEKQHLRREIALPAITFSPPANFHGISTDTLKEFEAFTTDSNGMEDYVWIPIYQNHKLIGVDGRYKSLGANITAPKYKKLPSGVDLSNILFPIDKIEDLSRLILVEGMYDMLKLWDMGIKNAICIFGVTSFNYKKAAMLSNYGCRHVTILMDGDIAGRKAAGIIKDLLTKNFIDSAIVDLPDGLDPGAFRNEDLETYLSEFMIA